VRSEHLASDLGVSWLVCAYQAELVATEDWNEAEEQEKSGYCEQDNELSHCGLIRQPLTEP
jgi:hypothetical protein